MLFDRSLRLMAALTTVYAFIMTIVSVSNLKALRDRQNNGSTSVVFGQKTTCQNLQKTEVVSTNFLAWMLGDVLGYSTCNQYCSHHHTWNVEHVPAACNISRYRRASMVHIKIWRLPRRDKFSDNNISEEERQAESVERMVAPHIYFPSETVASALNSRH